MANELALSLAKAICRKREGFYPRPYLCPAGIPTIGLGTTRYENGRCVTLADPPIDQARAEQLLAWEIETQCLPAVERLCPGVDQPVKGALLDFVYNLGSGRLAGSTLRKKVNALDWQAVRTELMKWVMGGGRVLKGLVLRRTDECQLVP